MPALVIDVDGVLSPYTSANDPAWGDGWADVAPTISGRTISLRLNARMGDAVARLGAPMFWLTTWDDKANDHVAPALGWPRLPVIGPWQRMDGSHAHKLAALTGWLADTGTAGPVVWVDDEFHGPSGALHGAVSSHFEDPPVRSGRLADLFVDDDDDDRELLLGTVIPYPVDRRVGLTVADVDRIRRLLDGESQPTVDPWTVRHTMSAGGPAVAIDGAPAGWREAHRFAVHDVYDLQIDFWAAWAAPLRL
ncbi:putative secreted protein (plasmid) [Euzebya pacifica]|uniref:Putative secreted protein n=1 Tax=Euzebya pacifica TaxID=1608957 RepID=A0A346Y6S6_9ACTN|nr:hypothetical protein [Euzebya pacifica]AXV10173.1 putative secreted protein [Euzebya pacifica]